MKEKFLVYPNLPEKEITLAAAGDYPEIIEALNKEGIKTLSFTSGILPEETRRHADMLLCHTGTDRIFAAPEIDTACLKKLGLSVFLSDGIKSCYPYDVKLNVAVGKSFFIYNPKTIDGSLLNSLQKKSLIGIPVNQGYSKCSVCFVTENAVITEDISIYRALQKTEIDSLLISQGDIFLSEKHSGFLGGSSGKINKDTLAITGELKYHRDADIIKGFCIKHKVKIKELKKGRITDIGSILPLTEKA